MRIFLAPRSNEISYKNFLSTIEHGIDPAIVDPHLDEEGGPWEITDAGRRSLEGQEGRATGD